MPPKLPKPVASEFFVLPPRIIVECDPGGSRCENGVIKERKNPKYLLQKELLVCWDWELDEHFLVWNVGVPMAPLPAGSASMNSYYGLVS